MFNFKKAELSDAEELSESFSKYRGRICDYSVGNVLFWRNYYGISFSRDDDHLILKYSDMGEKECYSYPISDKPNSTIAELLKDTGGTLCLTCLTEEQFESVSKCFDVIEVMHSEDWDDYLYNKKDIVSLAGRKYSGQRNHINKFKKLYPDAKFDVITKENVHIAKQFCLDFFDHIGNPTKVSDTELCQLKEQLDNWEIYKQLGGILSVGDKVVGVSVGEIVKDTLIVHTEKADTSFDGAYPMLVNCFAREFAKDEDCLFINREEDCGIEGLRISKQSYHPIEIIKKYAVTIKELS